MSALFRITSEPLERHLPLDEFKAGYAGAIVTFTGIVRNINDHKSVLRLEYETDSAFAEAEAASIMQEALERFDIIHASGLHRMGLLSIGEMAVWVGVSARHRDQAYKASRYIIDEIKKRLPVWKKEHYASGSSEWINPQTLTQFQEKDYYSRHLTCSSVGKDGQQKLKNARVIVIGAGGLGCPALTYLASSGVGTIGICDCDIVEIHNLQRQTLYTAADLGRRKTEAACERLSAMNPLIRINTFNEKLNSKTALEILAPYDLIIDGTDNFAAKFLLNDYAVLHQKPLIQASVYQTEGEIRFYQPGHPLARCLRCTWPQIPEAGCAGNCQQAGVLSVTPGLIGTWMAAEAVKFIIGLTPLSADATLIIDVISGQTRNIRQPASPNCPVCSPSAVIHSLEEKNDNPSAATDISIHQWSPADLKRFIIIDIRSSEEQSAAPCSAPHKRIPINDIRNGHFVFDDTQSYLLVCARGVRSLQTAQLMRKKNILNVYSLEGGINTLNAVDQRVTNESI